MPGPAVVASWNAHPFALLADKLPNPIRPTDDEARQLGRDLIASAAFGAIAVHHPETGAPHATRIAIARQPDGAPLTLISDLSLHTKALTSNPNCALLLGEPGPKGDPLTHPRITLTCRARFMRDKSLRDHYLAQHPKAALYIDFTDFRFVAFDVVTADLNGGFGKAYQLSPADLGFDD